MESDEGREELRAGSFDLDKTAKRIMEVSGRDRLWVVALLGRIFISDQTATRTMEVRGCMHCKY